MILDDILKNPIEPFEIDDPKLMKLFSYYLHLAPTIESRSSKKEPTFGMEVAWERFIDKLESTDYIYKMYKTTGNIDERKLKKYQLHESDDIDRRSNRFICYPKKNDEMEMNCLLRHMRNSIAHSNVYLLQKNSKGRKYLIFDDYNTKKNMTARIILTQTVLVELKKILTS